MIGRNTRNAKTLKTLQVALNAKPIIFPKIIIKNIKNKIDNMILTFLSIKTNVITFVVEKSI